MSFSAHGFMMPRASYGDATLRPILASMDNMTLAPSTAANDGKAQSKSTPLHECQECNKGLKATSFGVPQVDTMGVCCRKCYSKTNKVYCDECMHCSGDVCATCQVFFCQECLEEVNLIDLFGHRYCSEKCAPQNLSPLMHHKDYENALGSMGAKLSVAKQLFCPESPQQQSNDAIRSVPTPTQPIVQTTPARAKRTRSRSTPQSSKRKGCAWCRQSLKTRTTGPKSSKKTVGYYCNCNNRRVYCEGCANNHGDFCRGNCLKFMCRNCVPYDAWLHPAKSTEDAATIYCSRECVPEPLKAMVVRRTLFDDEDWETEEYIKPLSRRCQWNDSFTGQRCKITASHPCAAAKSLKKGDDFCADHGGFHGFVFSDDDSFDDGDYYFKSDG